MKDQLGFFLFFFFSIIPKVLQYLEHSMWSKGKIKLNPWLEKQVSIV